MNSETVAALANADDEMQDDLRPEYDATLLQNPVRGKHLAEYRAGTNLASLAHEYAPAP